MPSKPAVYRPPNTPSPAQAEKRYEQERRRAQPMRKAYYTTRWRELRLAVLREQPLCAECQRNNRITAADTVDHIKPHRGSPELFWDRTNLQPLCASCHSAWKQSQERA